MPRQPRPARAQYGWRIGGIGDVPVFLARSWVVIGIIAVVIFAPIAARTFPNSTAMVVVASLGFVVILLTAVLIHEVGHTLVARASGHSVHRVVVTAWGGHTSFSSANSRPGSSLLIALVGPAANLMLAGLFRLGYDSVSSSMTDERGVLVALILNAGVVVNALMGVFNLLPVLPLDGARALESLIWWIGGDRDRATISVAWLGRITVLGVVGWLLLTSVTRDQGMPVNLPLIGLFAFFGWRSSGTALRQVGQQRRIDALSLDQLTRPARPVDQNSSVAIVAAEMTRTGTDLVVLIDYANVPQAYIEADVVERVPPDVRTRTAASSVAVPLTALQPLPPHLHGGELLEQIRQRAEQAPVLVVADPARVIGLVWVRDVVLALK